jgi:hypothetical protein
MSAVATAIVTSTLVGAYSANKASQTQSEAADKASQAQVEASKYASDLQQKQYEENVQRQQPFYQAGVNALPELVQASRYTPFGQEQFQADPGYAFRLSEGQKALDRSAAARGGLISGGALKAATRFGQEMGSQEYTNAFNRYQAERQARLGPLQSLTGMGQTTAQQLGVAGAQNANTIGGYGMAGANAAAEGYMGAANARASGYIGTGNALTSGLGTYLNYSNQQNLLAALKGGGASASASGAGYYAAPSTSGTSTGWQP